MDMLNPAFEVSFMTLLEAEKKYNAARKVLSLLNTLNNNCLKQGKDNSKYLALIKRHFKDWMNQVRGQYKRAEKAHNLLLSA